MGKITLRPHIPMTRARPHRALCALLLATAAHAARIAPSASRYKMCPAFNSLKMVAGPAEPRRYFPATGGTSGGGAAHAVALRPVFAWPDANENEVHAVIASSGGD